MKRITAINNLNRILNKVNAINGIYPTPKCDNEFLKIKRIWLFGSTLKGSDKPNDLDLLIELVLDSYSRNRKGREIMFRANNQLHGSFAQCKRTPYSVGVPVVRSSFYELVKFLRQGTKKTSIHFTCFGLCPQQIDKTCLVYPRNDFNKIQRSRT